MQTADKASRILQNVIVFIGWWLHEYSLEMFIKIYTYCTFCALLYDCYV